MGFFDIKKKFDEVAQKAKDNFEESKKALAATTSDIIDSTSAKINEIAESDTFTAIKGKTSDIVNQTSEKTSNLINEAMSGCIAFTANVEDASNSILTSISDQAGKLWENEILQQIIKSIEEQASAVGDKSQEFYTSLIESIQEIWESEKIVEARKSMEKFAGAIGSTAEDIWNSETMNKIGEGSKTTLKVISGMRAIEDRKNSIKTREDADKLRDEINSTNNAIRDDLNETLTEFGKLRIESLQKTVKVFLNYLSQLKQRSKGKEYEFLSDIDFKLPELKELKQIDMSVSEAGQVLAIGGGFAALALIGTPALVFNAVTAIGTASTGAAISGLSGAAASNAILAWLGGGAIASGGGGVAAGTIVMGAITSLAVVGVAVIAIGTLSSAYYARKYTEATEYLAETQKWAEEVKAGWIVIGALKKRVFELINLTQELETKTTSELNKLGELIPIFDNTNMTHVKQFQQCAILVKSMSEISQISLLDECGNIDENSSLEIETKTKKLLNHNL